MRIIYFGERIVANLADMIANFFGDLKSKNSKGQNTTNELPPTYVVRTNSGLSGSNSSLVANQPKIERDLVKVNELPTMTEEDYNKVSGKENQKDTAMDSDYISAFASKYGVNDLAIAETIYNVARNFGESPELLYKIANHESDNWNPRSYNKKSKAAGLFQFLPSTWEDVRTRLGGAKQGIVDPYNPEHNSKAAALYIQDIKKRLSKVKDGSELTDEDIYLGHFSGAGRASQVIRALDQGRGNRPANEVYLPLEIKNNPSVFYHNAAEKGKPFKAGKMKTIKEVYDTITQNVNKKDTQDISFYLPKKNLPTEV